MPNNSLSIVLPVFNESKIIEKTIRHIDAYVRSRGIEAEIIAIDDGSQDGTAAILEEMREIIPPLKIITHRQNEGYGSALRSGIKAAGKAWVLLMDSDGQFKIDSLDFIWPPHKANLYLGFRHHRQDSPARLIVGKIGNRISNIFLGSRIKDINCGFKLFRKDLLEPLTLSSQGGVINFEILYKLFRKHSGVILQQFKVDHYPRNAGCSTGGNPRVIFKIILEGVRIILGRQ
jgi:glycosyltransferase involved in cell wall biosynthesis